MRNSNGKVGRNDSHAVVVGRYGLVGETTVGRVVELARRINGSVVGIFFKVTAPAAAAEEEEKEKFYQQVQKVIHQEKEFYTVVMGISDGKVGTSDSQGVVVGSRRNDGGLRSSN